MKYYALFVLIFFCTHQKSISQMLPPQEDREFLQKRFVSQSGWIGNNDFKGVFCFTGIEGSGDKLYLVSQTNTIHTIEIPDLLVDKHFTITSSGPNYFCIETQSNEKWFYYFEGNRSGFLTKFADKNMRGHDGTDPMD